MVFDERWFKQNQWWILPYVSHDRDNLFIGTNKPLVSIAPDHVSWLEEPGLVTTEFHVHHVYGRRLYQRLSPLWNLMHRIDMSTFGRASGLNFGFDTLTAYPDADAETDTVDGHISSNSPVWSTVHDSATGGVSDNANTMYTRCRKTTVPTYYIYRTYLAFKTSSLGAGATISAATMSLITTTLREGSPIIHAVGWASPVNSPLTALDTGDYDGLGTDSFANVTATTDNTWYDFALDGDGIATIAKAGISAFGLRIDKDIANSAPVSNTEMVAWCSADDTTANNGQDPKLVVTYTAAATFVPKCIFL